MATSETTRARRFALPDLSDKRAEEYIEAFLDGPNIRRHHPSPRRKRSAPAATTPAGRSADPAIATLPQVPAVPATEAAPALEAGDGNAVTAPVIDAHTMIATRPSTDIRTIPGRLDFYAALERESLRAARYNRPAAVAIVDLKPERAGMSVDPWLRTVTGSVIRTLRGSSRATDLVARVASTRFQVLLPETAEAGASRFAERVSTACHESIESAGAPMSIQVSVAIATPDHPLHEALANALRAIEAA